MVRDSKSRMLLFTHRNLHHRTDCATNTCIVVVEGDAVCVMFECFTMSEDVYTRKFSHFKSVLFTAGLCNMAELSYPNIVYIYIYLYISRYSTFSVGSVKKYVYINWTWSNCLAINAFCSTALTNWVTLLAPWCNTEFTVAKSEL